MQLHEHSGIVHGHYVYDARLAQAACVLVFSFSCESEDEQLFNVALRARREPHLAVGRQQLAEAAAYRRGYRSTSRQGVDSAVSTSHPGR